MRLAGWCLHQIPVITHVICRQYLILIAKQNRREASMSRIALTAWIVLMSWWHGLMAQSIVFVSPSTKGLLTMSCAEGSLGSFEQQHYLAAAHHLATALCAQPQIDSAVGVWKGQAENSGMIDGCPNDRARVLGALLAKYYHQEQALVFDRSADGKTSLVSFHASQPLGVIAIMMAQAKLSGATVIPHIHDNLILIVATDPDQHARCLTLYSLLHGADLHEEPGTTELIGDNDRVKARDIYIGILSHAPADVRQLDNEMYSEQFNDLGLEVTPEIVAAH
jgi:hypothetical protein